MRFFLVENIPEFTVMEYLNFLYFSKFTARMDNEAIIKAIFLTNK